MKLPTLLLMMTYLSGCAVSNVSDSVEAVPDWFAERRDELAGEEYPTFRQADVLNETPEATPWPAIINDLDKQEQLMLKNAPPPVDVTEEEMRAWAAEQRALVAKGEEPY